MKPAGPREMLCYTMRVSDLAWFFSVFQGVRAAPRAQRPVSVAAQVSWQAKQTKFGFIQVYSCGLHLVFPTENRTICGGHEHHLINFFTMCIRPFGDSPGGDRLKILERMVLGSSAFCSELLVAFTFFFCDAVEPSGASARNLPQPGRRHFEVHIVLSWDRALPPPFWGRYTTPLCRFSHVVPVSFKTLPGILQAQRHWYLA